MPYKTSQQEPINGHRSVKAISLHLKIFWSKLSIYFPNYISYTIYVFTYAKFYNVDALDVDSSELKLSCTGISFIYESSYSHKYSIYSLY